MIHQHAQPHVLLKMHFHTFYRTLTLKHHGPINMTGAYQLAIPGYLHLTANYELIAVVEHIGEFITGGHYICHVLPTAQTAYTINDDYPIEPVDLKKLENGLIFIYKRM